ncbi:MAG: F0F1 ATP synthase subunit A, partial [Pseudomonadota bacterium]
MAGMMTEMLNQLMRNHIMDVAKMAGPLEQFEIKRLIPLPASPGALDLSVTNSTLWMFIGLGVAVLFLTAATRRLSLVPGGIQSLAEMTYEFIAKMVRDAMGDEGR